MGKPSLRVDFKHFLKEEGNLEEVEAVAIKRGIAFYAYNTPPVRPASVCGIKKAIQ